VSFMLPAELTAGLRALSQRHGVTLFMTLLSAWGVLLARLSGQVPLKKMFFHTIQHRE